MKSKWIVVSYWVLTVLLFVPLAGTGVPEALGHPSDSAAQAFHALDYPLYLARITGAAKALGVLVILFGRFSRLKEWAYAGYACLFLGATSSHLLAKDTAHAPYPFVAFALMMVSYLLWRQKQRWEQPPQII
jgi:uncharacterized membrane protein YphA (DoxX/SURF4 family)